MLVGGIDVEVAADVGVAVGVWVAEGCLVDVAVAWVVESAVGWIVAATVDVAPGCGVTDTTLGGAAGVASDVAVTEGIRVGVAVAGGSSVVQPTNSNVAMIAE